MTPKEQLEYLDDFLVKNMDRTLLYVPSTKLSAKTAICAIGDPENRLHRPWTECPEEYLQPSLDFLMRFFKYGIGSGGWTHYSNYTDDGHATARTYHVPRFGSIQELKMKLDLGMKVTITSKIVKLW